MKPPLHHSFDDGDNTSIPDNTVADTDDGNDNVGADRFDLSDIVRHTGDILKRRGLLLEKKLSAASSQFDDDGNVAVLHDVVIPPPSNTININTKQSHNSNNNIQCRDAREVAQRSRAQLGSPQQRTQNNQHYVSQPTNDNNYISRGRRRALRWISDRASQDEERRKKELPSSPKAIENSCSATTTTTTTTTTTSAATPPPIADKIVLDPKYHRLVSSKEYEVSSTPASNAHATNISIHYKFPNHEKTIHPRSNIIQRPRHQHFRNSIDHKTSSTSVNATTQIKAKAIHSEREYNGTTTTHNSNTAQHCQHVDHSSVHEPSCTATDGMQFKKKAMQTESDYGGVMTTTPKSSMVQRHHPSTNTTTPYHAAMSGPSSSNIDINTIDPNTERLLRFHEAYNAIIRATSQHLNNEGGGRNTISDRWLQSGGKRWTRDPNIVSAVSIDGRVYEDLQRTPTLSLKQITKGTNHGISTATTNTLYDRAATWFSLVTPPKHPHYAKPPNDKLGNTNKHDGDYGKQNGNDIVSEEDSSTMHAYQMLLHGTSNHHRKLVPIRQFSIDYRIPESYHNKQRHDNAEKGRSVTISTLQLLFTGGQNVLASKPKRGSARRKKLHQRRSIFDKESQGRRSEESEMSVNGRRRVLNKTSNVTVVGIGDSTIANGVQLRNTDTTEIVSPVSNSQKKEDIILSSPPLSPQDRFNVIDFFKESLLYHLSESSIIDTDGTEIDILDEDFLGETHNSPIAAPTARVQSMLMSPSLITKRYQQALKAIEHRNWKQISHMTNANPWLMEMKDVRNDQSLVHTLAFFGGELNSLDSKHLPEQLVRDIIEYEPSAVHKLDIEGNLPMHMAAASGNVTMIEELGRRFPSAASVQNHYGLLPLHLAVISYSDLLAASSTTTKTTSCTILAVELLLEMFPGAVGVKDHDGNLPLHMAAATLRGDDGARVINLLQKVYHDWTMASVQADNNNPPPPVAGMCKNNVGETSLGRAIQSRAGRDMIEALLHGEDGGKFAALEKDSGSRNALHLALDCNFHDASVVLSILKAAPITATIIDGDGMLPIQLACRNSLQHEIILAISIIDLPIDLGAVNGDAVMREGYGASWWYLLCESNDEYVGVVQNILSMCSRPQKVALCLARQIVQADDIDRSSKTVISCATPLCELELRKRCLFWNRFEIIGDSSTMNHAFMHKFDAVDHGGTCDDSPRVWNGGKRVSLSCYCDTKSYKKDVEHLLLHSRALDPNQFQDLLHLAKEDDDDDNDNELGHEHSPYTVSYQYCIVAEEPRKTLADVIAQMSSYDRRKYLRKSRVLLHGIAKSLYHLHTNNIIHGCIDSTSIGKFGSTDWKITGLVGSVVTGDDFPASRLGLHSPPEAFVIVHDDHERKLVSVTPSLKAEPTVDVWAFGKLLYQVLVGESLLRVFLQKKMKHGKYHQQDALKCLLKWNDDHYLPKVTEKLLSMGITATGLDLVSKCLCEKRTRTTSMNDIVNHPYWDG